MPLYHLKEFAELTGTKTKHFSTYEKRQKLVITEDRKIDSTNEVNKLFMELNKPKDLSKPKTATKPNATTRGGNTASKTTNKAKEPQQEKQENQKQSILVSLEMEKKRLEVEKLKRQLETAEEDLKKKRGESVDLNEALTIVTNYSSNLKKDLAQQLQIHIQEICVRHNISADKAGQYKLKILDIINASSNKSINILNELK